MAEYSKFFNSAEGDIREYPAAEFAGYFGKFLSNGVYTIDELMGLKVSTVTGFQIKVSPGAALINGYEYINDADINFTLSGSDVVLGRIDRVVLKLDIVNRNMKVLVKKGSLGSVPNAPTLTKTNDIIELPLAQIRIDKNTNTGVITDERVPIHSLIEIPYGDLRTEFDEWVAARQNSIGVEVYGGDTEPSTITQGDLWFGNDSVTIIEDAEYDILERLASGNYKRKNPRTTGNQVIFKDTAASGDYKNVKYKMVVVNGQPYMEVIDNG